MGEETTTVKLSAAVSHHRWHPTDITGKLYFWKSLVNRRDFRMNNRPQEGILPFSLSFRNPSLPTRQSSSWSARPFHQPTITPVHVAEPFQQSCSLLHKPIQYPVLLPLESLALNIWESWILTQIQILPLPITCTFIPNLIQFPSNSPATNLYRAFRATDQDFRIHWLLSILLLCS